VTAQPSERFQVFQRKHVVGCVKYWQTYCVGNGFGVGNALCHLLAYLLVCLRTGQQLCGNAQRCYVAALATEQQRVGVQQFGKLYAAYGKGFRRRKLRTQWATPRQGRLLQVLRDAHEQDLSAQAGISTA